MKIAFLLLGSNEIPRVELSTSVLCEVFPAEEVSCVCFSSSALRREEIESAHTIECL